MSYCPQLVKINICLMVLVIGYTVFNVKLFSFESLYGTIVRVFCFVQAEATMGPSN